MEAFNFYTFHPLHCQLIFFLQSLRNATFDLVSDLSVISEFHLILQFIHPNYINFRRSIFYAFSILFSTWKFCVSNVTWGHIISSIATIPLFKIIVSNKASLLWQNRHYIYNKGISNFAVIAENLERVMLHVDKGCVCCWGWEDKFKTIVWLIIELQC